MSRIDEINTILDNLGSGATYEQVEFALRDYEKREVLDVLADRSLSASGDPFNGGTITEPLFVNATAAGGPTFRVDGQASTEFDDLLLLEAAGSNVVSVTTDGACNWAIQEEGSTVSFGRSVGDLSGSIMSLREYDVKFTKANADGGGNLLVISRENGGRIGFFGAAAAAKPTGVAVTAEAIHAALVTLGLIAGP